MLKILIITFSPAGSTLKIAKVLEEKLVAAKNEVQIFNITCNKAMFKEGMFKETFAESIAAHDVICIGSPVYEKHLEYYVQQTIKNLPKPDSKWGKYAVPFVTYGGISSGAALKEADRLLRKSGRSVIAAMKIETSHIVTKKLTTRVNEGMPGKEANPYIDELVKRISEIDLSSQPQVKRFSKELNYHTFKEKMLCTLMNERMLHKHKYPQFMVKFDKCTKCLSCTNSCPIQRIEVENDFPKMTGTKPGCIHCFSCVNSCPADAITFENDEKDWSDIERILKLVSADNSFFQSMEKPRSAVYPIIKK